MAKRNILLLGGTNYFGKHLVKMLLDYGDNVCIVTRGIAKIPAGCGFFNHDRASGKKLSLNSFWDVVYDQSCYSSDSLIGMEDIIKKCGKYILTSSQSVYSPGENIDENSIDYNKISHYQGIISDYGLEKIKSELIISSLTKSCIFPRFPVVVGANDPRRRLQTLVDQISNEHVCLPKNNPKLQILDELDAARVLFELPFKNFIGSINIASNKVITTEELCQSIANMMNIKLQIEFVNDFESNSFNLIKTESKTLLLEKQKMLKLDIKNTSAVVENLIKKALDTSQKCTC